jgi:hypothetical protein
MSRLPTCATSKLFDTREFLGTGERTSIGDMAYELFRQIDDLKTQLDIGGNL